MGCKESIAPQYRASIIIEILCTPKENLNLGMAYYTANKLLVYGFGHEQGLVVYISRVKRFSDTFHTLRSNTTISGGSGHKAKEYPKSDS